MRRLALVTALVTLAAFGCDTRIVEAAQARVTVAVPLPAIAAPAGAPPLSADLEIPGRVAAPLAVEGGVARGAFDLNVGDTTQDFPGVVRVRGQLTPADAVATLAVADVVVTAGPGAEVAIDDADFSFAPTAERPWLDLNRNGVENRADFERGCDPAVPVDFIRVSESALQLARDGDRAVLLIDNLLPRAVRLDVVVVDAPGVGVDIVAGVVDATSLPAVTDIVVGAGETVPVAVSFAAADSFFSQGLVSVVATDDVDDSACHNRMSVPVRVLANVAAPVREASPDTVVPQVPALAGVDAAAVSVAPVANLASGVPLNLDLSAAGSGQVLDVDGTVVPADRVFVVDVGSGARLDVALAAAPFDVDVAVVSLAGDAPNALLAFAPLPAGNTETLRLRNPNDFDGADTRVLVVVGVSGATEPSTLSPEQRRATVSLAVRVSEAPRLLTRPDPALGPVDGGTSVTFVGENLDAAGRVFFGDAVAACAFADAPNQTHVVSCETPEGTLTLGENPVDVVYRSPDGTSSATLVDGFRYVPSQPRIDVLEPAVVVVGANSAITVHGFGFVPPTTISIGGQTVVATVVDDRTLFVNLPDLAAGSYDLTVTVVDIDGTPFSATLVDALLVLSEAVPPPDLAGVFPASGDAAGGTTLNISGSHFSAGAQVFVDDVAADVIFVGGSTILAVTPAGPPGAADVRVENADGQEDVLVDAFTYVVPPQPPPVVFALVPSSGSTAGGESVTVLGAHFDDAATVAFDGVLATVSSRSEGALVVTAPAHAAGVVDVVVRNGDEQAATAARAYAYVAPIVLPPQVFSLTPNTGPTAGGTTVTVFGNRFAAPTVTLDGLPVVLTAQSETALTFVTPAHAAGAGDLVVTNGDGQSARIAAAFAWDDAVVAGRAPAVADVAPAVAHGTVGGERLRLIGVDLNQTVAATVVVGTARVAATIVSASNAVVVVDVANVLPAGSAFVEVTDGETGVHASPVFEVRDPVAVAVDFAGDAVEGGAFSLIITGSDLNPARLRGVRLTPVDARSGAEQEKVPTFQSEGVVTVDVDSGDLGRGAWVATLVYEDSDGDAIDVVVDSFVVGGFCPGAALCDTCGDNAIDAGEDCDGVDFGGATCADHGFDGGVLQCAGCQFDFTLCSVCGNGAIDVGEQCDGTNLASQTCTTRGFQAGTLSCGPTCTFNTTQCRTCGDTVCSIGETSANCPADCPATCGDGTCQQAPGGAESCDVCPRDCGSCAPYRVVLVAGDAQTARVTEVFPVSVRVRVLDADDTPVDNVDVTFSVSGGDVVNVNAAGTLGETTRTVATDLAGEAATLWVPGLRPGVHHLAVTATARDGAAVTNQPLVVNGTAVDEAGIIVHAAGRVSGALQNVDIAGRPASRTTLGGPRTIATEPSGNLLILEAGRLVRLLLPEGVYEHVAGSRVGTQATTSTQGDGGPAALAGLRDATHVAVAADGTIYIMQNGSPSATLRRISTDGIITTVLGGAADNANPNDGDGGPPEGVFLASSAGMGVDENGDVLLLESTQNVLAPRIRRFTATAPTPTTSTLNITTARVAATGATLGITSNNAARSIVAVRNGVLATALNSANSTIGQVLTLVSAGGADIPAQNINTAGSVVCTGPDGAVYSLGNTSAPLAFRNDGIGGQVTLVGGARVAGGAGDLGPALTASLDNPTACAIDAAGNFFIVDGGRIRVIRGTALSTPVSASARVRSGNDQTGLAGGALPSTVTFEVLSSVTGVTTPTSNVLLHYASTQRGTFAGADSLTTAAGAPAAVRLGRVVGAATAAAPITASLPNTFALLFPTVTATATATMRLPLAGESTAYLTGAGFAPPGNINTIGFDADAGNILGSPFVTDDGRLIVATVATGTNSGVLEVDVDGAVARLAGGGSGGDGGPAIGASFSQSVTAIEDHSGNIYVVDNPSRVRRIDTSGFISTYAGTGAATFTAPVDALAMRFESLPLRLAIEEDDDLVIGETEGVYIVDGPTHVIRKIVDRATCSSSTGLAVLGVRSLAVTQRPNGGGAVLVARVDNGGGCPIATGTYMFDIDNNQLVLPPARTLSTTAQNVAAAALDDAGNVFWISDGTPRVLNKTTTAGVTTTIGGFSNPIAVAVDPLSDLLYVYDGESTLAVLPLP